MHPINQHKRITPAEQQTILDMRAQGYTAGQIAERLGRTEGAVRQIFNRYKARVKEEMRVLDDITEAQSSLVLVDLGFKVVKAGTKEEVTRDELLDVIKLEPNGPDFLRQYQVTDNG